MNWSEKEKTMKTVKVLSAIALMATLGACNTVGTSRNAPLEKLPELDKIETVSASVETKSSRTTTIRKSTAAQSWRVQDVRVNVPESLSVSEANLYFPGTDIVWREDRFGDRRAQVASIVDLAVSQAAIGMTGNNPVYLDIELKRFHALTQKARASVGGTHSIQFDVIVRDVEGNPLIRKFPVEIKLKAYGGSKAIAAEMRGETQKVRITREIARVMRKRLGV